MGRHSTQPQVEDTGFAFIITRVLDPDDEFAVTQWLSRRPWEPYELYWQDEEIGLGEDVLAWQDRREANKALDILAFGQEEGIEEARRRLS